MRTENLRETVCPVCNGRMVIQIDGQMKRTHGGNCRKEFRKNPEKYHKCNYRMCTGRRFEEIGGMMICEKQMELEAIEKKRQEEEQKKLDEEKITEVPKVKRKEENL